ncbi:hypothetical protein BASA81_015185 [Batrachochytrium salamandrivorans]|nr:hypothetical protein BASA81_015185 [Batrachochytrium salamandrivorans]
MYTTHQHVSLPLPMEDAPTATAPLLLSISSVNQAAAPPPPPLPEVAAKEESEHKLVMLFRLDALLAKFSTRSTEVLLLGVSGVSASLQLSASHDCRHNMCEVDWGVKQIQLESLMPSSEFPVVASFSGNGEEDCLHIHSLFTRKRPWFFKDIRAELGPVVLNVEDDTIKQWIVIFAPVLASMAADWKLLGRSGSEGGGDGQSLKPKPLFVCETLELGAVQCLLTLKTSQGVFVGIDRTPLSLWPVSAANVRCSVAHLGSELAANYLADLLLNSPALLGSLEIIGNPTGFIRSLALGVHALVATPFRELKRGWGPRGLLRGVVLGWLGLLSHVADGALTSVSGFSASLARNLHLSIARKQASSPLLQDSSRLQSVLRGMVGVVVRPAGNAAELVSQATKRITTRLRPAVVRLQPMEPQTHLQVDLERMLAWNLFGGENVLVLRTDVCEFDVDEDGARSSCQVRVLLTSKGVCALRGSCLLHNAREWLFVHPWADIVSVQESLSKLNLAVLLVKDDNEASQQKLLRFTFQSETQRRGFVLDALANM